jgi:formylmethanofuran dehydrogenase subunit E
LNLPKENNQHFVGTSFQRKLCEFLPLETLLQINDLRQAGYSDPHIMESFKIPIVPPIDMVSYFIISCSKCGDMGHKISECYLPVKVSCAKCFGLDHVARACVLG